MKQNWENYWKDYYKILQVHPTAGNEVIKAAYDRLARKYHPDLNKDLATGGRMKDINEAFEILGNLEKRRRYHPVWLQKIGRGVPGPEPAMEKSPAGSSPTDEVNVPPVSRRNGFPNVVRWIAIIPAGLAVAVLVMFPVHWLIVITAALGDNPFLGLLSAETAERLANAFTSPFFFIYIGARIAPTHRGVTSIVLAIIMALIMGGVYVLAFTGGPMFRGWSSLYFGATPTLNLAGIVTAIYKVRRRWGA